MSPHCDLDPEHSKTITLYQCVTLWLMMMHHHTKFGYKSLNCSYKIISHGQTFTSVLNFHCDCECDLDFDHSNSMIML